MSKIKKDLINKYKNNIKIGLNNTNYFYELREYKKNDIDQINLILFFEDGSINFIASNQSTIDVLKFDVDYIYNFFNKGQFFNKLDVEKWMLNYYKEYN